MKAYFSRYIRDLKSFIAAYLLAIVAVLPFAIYFVGPLFPIAYMAFAFLGLPTIGVVALVSAALENYIFKFAVYVAASFLFAYVWGWGPVAQEIYDWEWMRPYAFLFLQIVLLFGIFYVLLERGRIAAWYKESQAAYWAHFEGPN